MRLTTGFSLLSCASICVAFFTTACGASPAPGVATRQPATAAVAPVAGTSSAFARSTRVKPAPAEPGCRDFELPYHVATHGSRLAHGTDACVWRAFDGAPDARALLERACAARSARACLNLGMFLLAHPPDVPDTACMATGVPTVNGCSKMTAIGALARGCELGEPVACEREASHLFAGIGVSRDLDRAGQLFDQACKAGVLTSCRYRAPDAPSSRRPECKRDADCVLVESAICPGRCECPQHPHASAADVASFKRLRAECERQRRILESERLRGLPEPRCSLCPVPTDPPPAQPSHAICAAGVCVAI
ncbi:MAG: sel1 repeat family protein [Polyangiaceae bacterium]|nr:sel1 repeat family protein [Polyangiaceae bacterium]